MDIVEDEDEPRRLMAMPIGFAADTPPEIVEVLGGFMTVTEAIGVRAEARADGVVVLSIQNPEAFHSAMEQAFGRGLEHYRTRLC